MYFEPDGVFLARFLAGSESIAGQASESGIILGMHLDAANPLLPIVTIAAGVFLLIAPRVVSFSVAVYLIVAGMFGLNGIYHIFK